MKILVLADTHIPRAAADLPKEIYDEIPDVDMIIHAGDLVEKELLEKLTALKETRAVCGNMDASNLQHILSQKEVIQVEKVKIGLIHGYGAPNDILETVRGEFDSSVDAIIFGHSHAAVNMVRDGVLFFNPGSPTDKIFAASNSYGILEINGKKIDARIVELDG